MRGDRSTRVPNPKVTILCYLIAIIGSFQLFWGTVEGRSTAGVNRNENEVQVVSGTALDEVDHKLLHECQKNLDYRSYIKCLKREKRHEAYDKRRSCLDACFEMNCTTSKCIHDCHTHCRKKLIETYSKTVETYDCRDNDCAEQNSGSSAAMPNITTHIHIHNIMPNNTNSNASLKDCEKNQTRIIGSGTADVNSTRFAGVNFNGSNPWGPAGTMNGSDTISTHGGSNVVPKIDINNIINNQYAAPPPFMGGFMGPMCACPGCNCFSYPWPPVAMMPQYPNKPNGSGPFPSNGCMFPGVWPCFPPYQPSNASKDCSYCKNPIFQAYCDPSCLTSENKESNNQNVTTAAPNNI